MRIEITREGITKIIIQGGDKRTTADALTLLCLIRPELDRIHRIAKGGEVQ